MANFQDFTEDEKAGIVQIMRAEFNCKQPKKAWLQAAEQINPFVISATSVVPENIVLLVAKQAGEQVI